MLYSAFLQQFHRAGVNALKVNPTKVNPSIHFELVEATL